MAKLLQVYTPNPARTVYIRTYSSTNSWKTFRDVCNSLKRIHCMVLNIQPQSYERFKQDIFKNANPRLSAQKFMLHVRIPLYDFNNLSNSSWTRSMLWEHLPISSVYRLKDLGNCACSASSSAAHLDSSALSVLSITYPRLSLHHHQLHDNMGRERL